MRRRRPCRSEFICLNFNISRYPSANRSGAWSRGDRREYLTGVLILRQNNRIVLEQCRTHQTGELHQVRLTADTGNSNATRPS